MLYDRKRCCLLFLFRRSVAFAFFSKNLKLTVCDFKESFIFHRALELSFVRSISIYWSQWRCGPCEEAEHRLKRAECCPQISTAECICAT